MPSPGVPDTPAEESTPSLSDKFAAISNRISAWAGSYKTFLLAIAVIVVWAVSGPIFKFSDTWQLVINTGTTIVTFLMVFLIQNTQNRDAMAVHLKLDELIRAMESADDKIIAAESISEEKMTEWHERYHQLTEEHAEIAGKTESVQDEVKGIKKELESVEAQTA
jgi:low affinity Fe/Cu permease